MKANKTRAKPTSALSRAMKKATTPRSIGKVRRDNKRNEKDVKRIFSKLFG